MAAQSFRIKIAHGDQQFEAEGDKAFVLQMLRRFESGGGMKEPLQVAPARGSKREPGTSMASTKAVSAGEYIRRFRFKKHTDFVLAFGYYLEKNSGLSSFTAADINNCYYEAKMESSNTSQMIVQNIRRSFMMEARKASEKETRRRYTLTKSGEEYLLKAIAKETDQ